MVYISAYQVNTHAFKRTIKFNACQHCEEVVEKALILVHLCADLGKLLVSCLLSLLDKSRNVVGNALESTQLLCEVVHFLNERCSVLGYAESLESCLSLFESLVSNSLGCVCILLSACCGCTGGLGGGLNLVDQTLSILHSLQRLVGVLNSCGKA